MTAQLQSSCLHSASVENDDLFVTFKTGDVYKYPGEAQHFESLKNAQSAGRYFNEHIYHLENVQVG